MVTCINRFSRPRKQDRPTKKNKSTRLADTHLQEQLESFAVLSSLLVEFPGALILLLGLVVLRDTDVLGREAVLAYTHTQEFTVTVYGTNTRQTPHRMSPPRLAKRSVQNEGETNRIITENR